MALEALIQRVRQVKAAIIANRNAELLVIAGDALALIKLRIQSSGRSYQGSPLAPYTPEYARERQSAGYQVGYVDYTRTGRLWAGVRPSIEKSNIFSSTVVIKSEDADGERILNGAEKKRGNLLQPSREELEFVKNANINRLRSHLKFG